MGDMIFFLIFRFDCFLSYFLRVRARVVRVHVVRVFQITDKNDDNQNESPSARHVHLAKRIERKLTSMLGIINKFDIRNILKVISVIHCLSGYTPHTLSNKKLNNGPTAAYCRL